MKKFVQSMTAFVDLENANKSEDLLDNTIRGFHKVAEDHNFIIDIQVSAVMKPLTLEKHTLCYSVTALYYEEA